MRLENVHRILLYRKCVCSFLCEHKVDGDYETLCPRLLLTENMVINHSEILILFVSCMDVPKTTVCCILYIMCRSGHLSYLITAV